MRIVSLVPSLTETLFEFGLGPDQIVGRTSWCVEPRGTVERIPSVGGTKTPSVRSIERLKPDLVVLEREENRKETWRELESKGIRTWVTHITRVSDVPPMLQALGEVAGRPEAGATLAAGIREEMANLEAACGREKDGPAAAALIWNDPLMAVSPHRYAGDIVRRAGFRVPDLNPGEAYPRISPKLLGECGIEVLLLTSEPHDFSIEEGEAAASAVAELGFKRPWVAKVDGQALTWFGARTLSALRWWRVFRRATGEA